MGWAQCLASQHSFPDSRKLEMNAHLGFTVRPCGRGQEPPSPLTHFPHHPITPGSSHCSRRLERHLPGPNTNLALPQTSSPQSRFLSVPLPFHSLQSLRPRDLARPHSPSQQCRVFKGASPSCCYPRDSRNCPEGPAECLLPSILPPLPLYLLSRNGTGTRLSGFFQITMHGPEKFPRKQT